MIRESEKIIGELKAWVNGARGRRVEIAKELGKSPQLISDWLAGRAAPRLDEAFKLREFLQKQTEGKESSPKKASQRSPKDKGKDSRRST
jgi:transcriptional regulator with XRE-family HTH domain